MLEDRVVVEIDDGLKKVAAINFDPNVRDWLPQEGRHDAEIVVTAQDKKGNMTTASAGVRRINYMIKKRSMSQDINIKKYELSPAEQAVRDGILAASRRATGQ
jgi:hypothetical protein